MRGQLPPVCVGQHPRSVSYDRLLSGRKLPVQGLEKLEETRRKIASRIETSRRSIENKSHGAHRKLDIRNGHRLLHLNSRCCDKDCSGGFGKSWCSRRSARTQAGSLDSLFSSNLHSCNAPCTGCAQRHPVFHLRDFGLKVQSQNEERLTWVMKIAVEVCPLCQGTGWKMVPGSRDQRVTRCDCRIQARSQVLLASARIPKRYEHCVLSSFESDFPDAHPSLSYARIAACKFGEEYEPREGTGLLIIGKIGVGKTHLAVGIIKDLILSRGASCLFYDYRELLKQIQNSYNDSVKATELDVLRPVFD